MSERSLELRIGIFVFLGLAIFCGMLVVVEADLLRETYLVTAVLNDATGLKPGVPVRLGGVDIGQVESIRLPGTDIQGVEVRLAIRKGVAVRKDAGLFVATQGLLGERYLEFQLLIGAGQNLPTDGAARVVGIVPPTLSKLTESASQLIVNINKIFESPEFEGNIKATAENAKNVSRKSSEFMDSAKAFMTRLDEFLVRGEDVLAEFRKTAEHATTAIDSAEARVSEVGKSTAELMVGLQENSARLQESLEVLMGMVRRVDQGEGTLGQFVRNPEIFQRSTELLELLSVAVFNLNRTIEYLYENPSDLFWGKSDSDKDKALAEMRVRQTVNEDAQKRLEDEFARIEARRRKP